MPLANLKLLVRPNPGGLADHRSFLAEEARRLGSSGRFSDLVMISEEGDQVHCHLSLVVPISPLLKAIIPPSLSSAETYKLSLPVSSNTLKSMMLLLYTGEARASETQMADIRDGLTLLGILQHDPAAQLEKKVPKIECEGSSLAVGINSCQAELAASALSVPRSVSTVEMFAQPGERESSSDNLLSLHPVKQEDAGKAANLNNNTEVETVRTRRRRRVSDCREEEEEATETDSELTKSADEIVLDGTPITQNVESCLDCGVSLASEWHRPPNRHDCQAMSETVCQYCQVTVRGSWYLPPSRHHCPGYSPSAGSARKRRRLFTSPRTEIEEFSCPLPGCNRRCDSKKLLMLHLALSHYQDQLETLYIRGVCSEGGRVCPHCGDLQPGIKLNFLRHMAMEHEVVMELVERDIFQVRTEPKEEFDEEFNEISD